MEFDLALISMPVYTQKTPSLYLASLATYLKERQHQVVSYDFGIQFFQEELKKIKIKNPLIDQLNLSPYPLWGASNWLNFDNILNPQIGQFIIKSLCPVCSELYQPIFNEFKDQLSPTKKYLDARVKELANLDTPVYGFSLLLGNAMASLYIIKKIKEIKPEATIIVGGPEVSPFYRASFYSQLDYIDFVVYHTEGEIPLERILSHLKGLLPKEAIPGIYHKTQKSIYKTDPPLLLDLNQASIPNFELVQTGYKMDFFKIVNVIISKGCMYNCTFCNESLIWGSYRPKSAKRIFKELKYYVENHGISQFELGDNSFTSSPSLQKALERISNEGIQISWGGNSRLNELNNKKLTTLKQKGLTHCDIGIESASPEVLHLMGKTIDPSRAGELLKICHQNQIKTNLYFIVGFPGETFQEFQKTVEFVEKNLTHIDSFLTSVFSLSAGTPIFHSNLLIPIQLGPNSINAFTYKTTDGVTHKEREERFLRMHDIKNSLDS
ncbi:MAG: B12-binding domain-containing radical SAM protein [Candidatus Helarchaeota archaeon]|nr:B12-binding domain-containing radical SAM protein [Candidatus Helarchaeota archaeon]